MNGWIESYISALEVRDGREKANEELINACEPSRSVDVLYLPKSDSPFILDTRLADHTASLQRAVQEQPPAEERASTSTPPQSAQKSQPIPPPIVSSPRAQSPLQKPGSPSHDLNSLRQDLTAAQRSRSALSSELASVREQLAALQVTAETTSRSLGALQSQKLALERRLRDRDSELKEKGRMLERVQDEMVGLEMQVNVAEQEKARVKKENEELAKRLVGEAEDRQRARRLVDDDG